MKCRLEQKDKEIPVSNSINTESEESSDKQSNQFYYRNKDPGEPIKTGPWTEEEKLIFLKRVQEFGVNNKWGNKFALNFLIFSFAEMSILCYFFFLGLFSIAIPGRVGYQCADFYRKLLKSGELKDNKDLKDNNNYEVTTIEENEIADEVKNETRIPKKLKQNTLDSWVQYTGSSFPVMESKPAPKKKNKTTKTPKKTNAKAAKSKESNEKKREKVKQKTEEKKKQEQKKKAEKQAELENKYLLDITGKQILPGLYLGTARGLS